MTVFNQEMVSTLYLSVAAILTQLNLKLVSTVYFSTVAILT